MIDTLAQNPAYIAAGVIVLVGGLALMWVLTRGGEDDIDMLTADGGRHVTLQPPKTRSATFGLPHKIYRVWKHHKHKRKIGKKGYVQWFLVDDTLSDPKFVKPERKGGGVPEYEHEGETYLFPRDALVPDESSGNWTAIHRRGDAIPINVNEPGRPPINADAVKKYLEQRITTSPPGAFSFLSDMDASDWLKYIIVGFIGLILFQAVLGGGF